MTRPNELTTRHVEVLRYSAQGHEIKEIAKLMGLSRETVKDHRQAIYNRLGASNIPHAVAIAGRMGLLDGVEL